MPPPRFFDEDKVPVQSFDLKLIKRLAQYIRPDTRLILLAIVCALLSTVAQLAFNYLIMPTVDKGIESEEEGALFRYALWFLFLPLVWFALQYTQTYVVNYVGQHGMYRLRRDLFKKLQRLTFRYFDKHPLGRTMTRLTNDVEMLNELFSSGVVALVTDVFLLAGIILMMFYLNAKISLFVMILIPVIVIASSIFRKYAQKAYRKTRKRLADLNGFLQENIGGIRIVQVFNRENWSLGEFGRLNARLRNANLETVMCFSVFFPSIEFVSHAALVMIIWVGGHEYLQGQTTLGTMLLYIRLVEIFFQPLRDLSEKFNILQSAMAAAERIVRILDTKVEVESPPAPVPVAPLQREIEFRNVWFAYEDEEWVLQDVSFKVNAGERVAIVGPTGAGKTTIISLLARFYDIQKGSILIDGVDIREMDLGDLRHKLAIVLQSVFLFSDTVFENIRLRRKDIDLDSVKQAAEAVNASRFIERLPAKYDTHIQEGGTSLSMGQRQLMAFARALAFNPEILVLDEATSNIDTETELLIQDALETLFLQRTSIIIAHRLSTIRSADKIIVLHHGQVREIGTHQELVAMNGLYKRLVDMQYREVAV